MAESNKSPGFFKAMDDVMERFSVADYAIVARGVDGEMRSNWIAGTGDNIISDRERGMVLYGELALLQASILDRVYGPKPIPGANNDEV